MSGVLMGAMGAAGAGAFPRFIAAGNFAGSASGSSASVPVPAGHSPGDLLILVAYKQIKTGTISTPSGWTSLGQSSNGSGNTFRMAVFYRVADGSEGASVSVSYSGDGTSTRIMLLSMLSITGQQGVPEMAALLLEASTATPNPPSLTPSWGLANTRWFVLCTARASSATGLTSGPSGFAAAASFGTNPNLYAGHRAERAASQDPGVLTWDTSTASLITTLAVRGA